MCSSKNTERSSRLPEWLKIKLPTDKSFYKVSAVLDSLGLNTVCQGARCPNKSECFSKGVATFMIMGSSCTRACAFCNIGPGPLDALDPDEPRRISLAVGELGLKHAVVTSVTRDDLPDGGAGHFAAVIEHIQADHPGVSTEVLIPDFKGDRKALDTVLAAGPDILNHNLETVPRLYRRIRPQAVYRRSLELLQRAAGYPGVRTKSGLMVGLGEEAGEVREVIDDLAAAGCNIVTIGQYLRPSKENPEVRRYVPPEEFDVLAEYGRSKGVEHMFCGPLVRSSYNARLFV